MNYLVFFTSLVLVSVLVSATHTSHTRRCGQRFHGVRINYLTRRCEQSVSVGCRSPFPYSTVRECWRDFMGQGNICDRSSPCLNGGLCMPVQRLDRQHRRHRHYRCDCMGTRHYGRNCEHRCTRHPPRNEYATACLL